MCTLFCRRAVCALLALVFICGATPASARHTGDTEFDSVEEYNDWLASRSSTYRRNVNKLDDDIVKKFAIPILFGVTLSEITPNFGDPRGGGTRTHEGLDILAPKGVPIVTPTEAVVMQTGSGPNSGKFVYTANPGGETFVYMHLDTIADIKTGQLLKVGDTVGTVGSTGNAGETNHLHFEVRKRKALDPFPRIGKEFTLEEKMKYLDGALADVDDSDELMDLMVDRYSGILLLAEAQGIQLNTNLARLLRKGGGLMALTDVRLGLKAGDDGVDVKALQSALIVANVGPAAGKLAAAGATGYFGPVTKAAVIEYQNAFDMSATGVFTDATKSRLLRRESAGTPPASMESPADTSPETATVTLALLTALGEILKQVPTVVTDDLKVGTQSSEVSLVQTYLIMHGKGSAVETLKSSGATGYFGRVTELALREYQTQKGIPVTGVYDAQTRAAMIL